jgi:hypothetical protein
MYKRAIYRFLVLHFTRYGIPTTSLKVTLSNEREQTLTFERGKKKRSSECCMSVCVCLSITRAISGRIVYYIVYLSCAKRVGRERPTRQRRHCCHPASYFFPHTLFVTRTSKPPMGGPSAKCIFHAVASSLQLPRQAGGADISYSPRSRVLSPAPSPLAFRNPVSGLSTWTSALLWSAN